MIREKYDVNGEENKSKYSLDDEFDD